jgi:L-lactate permease
MHAIWSFFAKSKNRQILAWLGGGLVTVAAGSFAMVNYLWPAQETAKSVCAQQGVALGGNVSGSTITNSVSGSTIAVPCNETKK